MDWQSAKFRRREAGSTGVGNFQGMETMNPRAPSGVLAAPLVAVGALLLYVESMAGTLTLAHGGSDGAELAVAVHTFGIPHPTGYPTYVLLAQAFRFLPWGETLAARLNLFSTLAAALAAGLVAAIVADLLGRERPWAADVGAFGGGAALAVAGLFWSQALITEVYALHAFFLPLVCWLLLRWRKRGGAYLSLAGLALGLGLGNHVSLLFLLPGAVLFVAWAWRTRWRRNRARWEIPAALLSFLAGLSLYLYLPLRAAADPWLNWGDPSDWTSFWAHATAQAYHHYLFQVPLPEILGRLSAAAGGLLRDFYPWGLLLGLGGLYLLGKNDRPALGTLAVPAGLGLLLALTYGGADSQVHLLPLYVALSIAGGVAAGAVAGFLERRLGKTGRWAALLLPALSIVLVVVGWPQWSLRDDPGPLPEIVPRLAALPPGSILLVDRDELTFPLWYAQQVEGVNPDVAIVDMRLLEWPWYRRQLPARYPGLVVPESSGEILPALLQANPGRPAFALGPLPLPAGYRLRYEGLIYRVVP